MRQEFCLNHSSGLNAQNILSRILDQARLTGGLPKPVFLAFLSVAPVYHARVEARPKIMGILDGANIFQSTRPRGARLGISAPILPTRPFQSTRPRGARPSATSGGRPSGHISIHAPRVGRDAPFKPIDAFQARFQSTRPVWGATQFERHRWRWTGISIHTPRVGRDRGRPFGAALSWISIHTPRVGRDAY